MVSFNTFKSMKRNILLLLCLIFSTVAYSQCKIKTKGSLIKAFEKKVPIDIDILIKPKILFDKYTTVATNTFVKTTDGNYYLIIPYTRAYSARFEANQDTPIIFYLENSDQLTLKPSQEIDGKMILTKYMIFLYYNITRAQIEKLATSNIVSLRIYFIAEHEEIANTYKDDLGRYFEYEILSEKYRTNLLEAANCILQY